MGECLLAPEKVGIEREAAGRMKLQIRNEKRGKREELDEAERKLNDLESDIEKAETAINEQMNVEQRLGIENKHIQ